MFFDFGLSGVFHDFCKFDHHQGEGAKKPFTEEMMSLDCVTPASNQLYLTPQKRRK